MRPQGLTSGLVRYMISDSLFPAAIMGHRIRGGLPLSVPRGAPVISDPPRVCQGRLALRTCSVRHLHPAWSDPGVDSFHLNVYEVAKEDRVEGPRPSNRGRSFAANYSVPSSNCPPPHRGRKSPRPQFPPGPYPPFPGCYEGPSGSTPVSPRRGPRPGCAGA